MKALSFPCLLLHALLYRAAAMGLTDYGESVIFAPDWFGDASPDNALHTVDSGRWAFLPVMQVS